MLLRRILAALLLGIAIVSAAQAQRYVVFSVTGKVSLSEKGRSVSLTPRRTLTASDRINIGKESCVVLLEEKASKMHSFTTPGQASISQLVERTGTQTKQLSKQYMGYLTKRLFSPSSQKLTHPDTYMQAMATSYRSTSSDSLLLNTLCRMIPEGKAVTRAEEWITDGRLPVVSGMDVSFDLVDCTTGKVVGNDVGIETSCYVRVHNKTEEMLYVNVLNLDAGGGKYLVLPVDEASLCAHLIVPAKSTVSFNAEPFIFSGEADEETFLLVATKEPLDFSILMSPIASDGKGKTLPVGLYRNIYNVTE